jgi:hypothetical protein
MCRLKTLLHSLKLHMSMEYIIEKGGV